LAVTYKYSGEMEPICFKVPRQEGETLRVEEWNLPYFYEPIHFHNECQITYIIDSTGTLLVGNKLDKFREGELYLIGKNLPHVFHNCERYFEEDSTSRARAISIFFSYDTIFPFLKDIPESYNIGKLLEYSLYGIKINNYESNLIIPSMKRILKLEGFPRVIELLNILHALSGCSEAKLISTRTPLIMNEEDNIKMNRVFEYIMQNFRERILLNEVSAFVHMAPTSFCRYFKQRTQKTFSEFLTEVRIANACKLLSRKSSNVSEACYSSGYNNISNFHRHFLNVTGMTPNQYKKNC